MNPYQTSPLTLAGIERETAIDWTFAFAYTGAAGLGQFFQVSIPGVGEAPISVSDWADGLLYLTLRKVGRLTDRLFEKRAGDVVHFRGPYGHGFDLSAYHGKDLVVVTGGTGLAPVRGVLRRFIEDPAPLRSLHVITGFKSPADILYRSQLESWAQRAAWVLTVDKGDAAWTGVTGLVTEHVAKLSILKSPHARAIVVGPPLMMKFTTLELIRHGLPEDAITVSFERNMSCGLGKCGHCKIDETYVCVDGPVFPFAKARRLID
jgi:anaerobic sulfite reductase subunit B